MMWRYLRLFLHLLRFSTSKALEFRLDISFRVLMDAVFYLINILFFKILFMHTKTLGEYQQDQIMLFVGSYLTIDALDMIFVGNGLWHLPIMVQRGDLDYYLTRPISSRFFVSFRDIAVNSILNLFMALTIISLGVIEYHAQIPLYRWSIYWASMLLGFLLLYNIRFLFILPVFWLHSNNGFNDIFYSLRKTMERPSGIFTGIIKRILQTILPFALVVTFPLSSLFKDINPLQLVTFLLTVGTSFIVTQILWNLALKNYTSASS